MTKNEIIESYWTQCLNNEQHQTSMDVVKHFAELIAQHERDEIYKLVMESPFRQNVETEYNGEELLFALKVMAFDITSAIRARAQA
jgi:hypothetical protein